MTDPSATESAELDLFPEHARARCTVDVEIPRETFEHAVAQTRESAAGSRSATEHLADALYDGVTVLARFVVDVRDGAIVLDTSRRPPALDGYELPTDARVD